MNSNAIRDDYGFRLARAPGHAARLTATLLAIVPRRRMAAILGGAALSLALVAPASAVANVGRFTETTVFTDAATDDCRGVTGTLTGTDVLSYQTVETSQGFHFEGTDAATLTFAFTDGSYATAQSLDHLSFNAGSGVTVSTTAHVDTVNVYAADGQILWTATLRQAEHFTITSDGVVRVQFELGHLTGGC
jgi:hypothetical protein